MQFLIEKLHAGNIETIAAKAFRIFIRIYSLLNVRAYEPKQN